MVSTPLRVPFNKAALSIQDQCTKALGRGLVCGQADLEDTLSRISYYRLSGYLWWFQASPTSHTLKANTTLTDVLALYQFDTDLRAVLSECVRLIEVWFRGQFTNHLSNFAGPMGYVDPKFFASVGALERDKLKLKERLVAPTEPFIENFYLKYSDPFPPLWMSVEVMSLGLLSKWFDNLKVDSLRKSMAQDVGLHHDVLASYLRQLTVIRNASAHHNRLWNKPFVTAIKDSKKGDANLLAALQGTDGQTIYRALVYSAFIVRAISPSSTIPSRLKALLLSAENEWLDEMWVPEGFESNPIWH